MKTITAVNASEALNKNEAIIIDVRENEEWNEGHIENAFHAPLSNLPETIQAIDFKNQKNQKIIFHCLKGGRSAQAIEYLQENILKDYDLYNLEGGILAWAECDLPLIKPDP